jgi:hypothetical protein
MGAGGEVNVNPLRPEIGRWYAHHDKGSCSRSSGEMTSRATAEIAEAQEWTR